MNTFLETYRACLLASIAATPNLYAFTLKVRGTPEGVADDYCAKIRVGGVRIFALDSAALRATCKALKIKTTFKAMEHFIANHE